MPPSAQTVSRLLDRVYEAAAFPERWPVFLKDIQEVTQAQEFYFLMLDPKGQCNLSLQSGFDEKTVHSYEKYYAQRDVILEGFTKRVRSHGDWVGDTDSLFDRRTLCRSEIFNDFCQPNGNAYYCGAGFGNADRILYGGLGLSHTEAQGAFDAETIELIAILTPHLKRAFSLHRTLTQARAEAAEMRASMESLAIAMISVDSEGKVIRLTEAARRLVDRRDGLVLNGKTLQTCVRHEQQRLDALIAGACATGAGRGVEQAIRLWQESAPQAKAGRRSPSSGGAMLVNRSTPKRALQVIVSPFRSAEIFVQDRPAALIFISDPDAEPVTRAVFMRALYGLTPAEARLADLLAGGLDVAEIAHRSSTSQQTVRFQLKRIFEKTGARRQSELMKLLLGLPGVQ